MITLRSILKPADNTGAKKIRVIHVYVGSRRRYGHLADIVLASVIEVAPGSNIKKGEKVKAVIVRLRKEKRRSDGSYIRFSDNAAVIIDNSNQPRGTRIFGPIAREVKDKGFTKIASMAKEVV
jgi:large subunit ribosomal protein L14